MICTVLKKMDVNPIVRKTRLGSILAQALENAKENQTIVLIMAAVFSISKVVLVPDFAPVVPTLFAHLFRDSLQTPAFLCLAALSRQGMDGIDYPKLVHAATYYLSAENGLVREFAVEVFKDHLCENGVNVTECLRIFVESYHPRDRAQTVLIVDAFEKANAQSPLPSALMTRLTAMKR